MKNIKELKPVFNLLKEEKKKFILFCLVLLIIESTSIFTGYLNGAAVESITKLNLKASINYLLIYFVYSLTFNGIRI